MNPKAIFSCLVCFWVGVVFSQPFENPRNTRKRDQIAKANSILKLVTSNPSDSGYAHKDAVSQVLDTFTSEIADDLNDLEEFAQILADLLGSIEPQNEFESPEQVLEFLEQLQNSTNTKTFYENVADAIVNGLSPSAIISSIEGFSGDINSPDNENSRNPNATIYPKADSQDAPYSKSEEILRAAIQIPSDFEYGSGEKTPVILVPGTGVMGGMLFAPNFAKLLRQTDFADIVWLNVPDYLLDDAQVNSEFIAYAINYVSGISNKNVSVISWSQGGLDTQWVFTFWPSTRSKVSNFIPISPDFHGSEVANALDPLILLVALAPSMRQQYYDSNYVKTLREHGGDSAYVPTTSIYSGFDEIVQPQQGTNASAFLQNERNVPLANIQLQHLCPGRPAGQFYTHEGVLYNPAAYALIVDALTNGGPAQPSRIDLENECWKVVADGLNIDDVIATEALIPEVAIQLLIYKNKSLQEPPIKSYAQ